MDKTHITAEQVKRRFYSEAFATPVMDNTIRGLWCEFMLAEALGPNCRPIGFAWHPWDLQIGESTADYPRRIRIQVKNSASLQTWNRATGRISDSSFSLTWRKKPFYFDRDNPGVPCEEEGFLCDVFILCHHPETDVNLADQRDPGQWDFFILPVRGANLAVTDTELVWLKEKARKSGGSATTQRRPSTLRTGIRNRAPCPPCGIEQINIGNIRSALGLI